MKRLLNLFLLAALPAMAQVTVSEAWVRGTVAQQKATGAFMTLSAAQDSRLVAASSPVAGTVEVHEMSMSNDVMRMRQLDSLALPAGKPVKLVPGGYHLMLMQLQRPLADGDKVPLTLEIEDAKQVRSKVTVEAVVRPLAGGHQH
ncbi:copper chaperone PCu(A)C [Pseudoduganella danionis]|uniref:Copper chaperone PCu(A)C n=1 Tax=Pseudoduganella danionis TaxID=1890295 RepID=A0ABW9SL65_9BURK|nr:copper chaperone PCu(A)C [Pseudoduganella danionis]MTW32686.1 copper chaperone PCu(A)C [Pseudoduganella danionis]